MRLQDFIDFVNMDRWADPAYRAYDLLHLCGHKRVRDALKMVGYSHSDYGLALDLLRADMSARGVKCENLREVLCEWFVWQRLTDGSIKKWQLRNSSAA